jgi:hypothetical protein
MSALGRRRGQFWSPPIILVECGHRRLVAPYGDIDWVRNLRGSGHAAPSPARHSAHIAVTGVGPHERMPVFRKCLRGVAVVRSCVDVAPDSRLDASAAEAARHPVARVDSGKSRVGVEVRTTRRRDG